MTRDLPDAHFGPPANPPVDWRKRPDPTPDDDELRRTPRSVASLLGFDPVEVGMYPVPRLVPKPRAEKATSDSYVYHGTPRSNVKSIAEKGLTPNEYGNPLNFHDIESSRHYAGKNGALLRVRRSDLPAKTVHDSSTNRHWTSDSVAPHRIEIEHSDKSWRPLAPKPRAEKATTNPTIQHTSVQPKYVKHRPHDENDLKYIKRNLRDLNAGGANEAPWNIKGIAPHKVLSTINKSPIQHVPLSSIRGQNTGWSEANDHLKQNEKERAAREDDIKKRGVAPGLAHVDREGKLHVWDGHHRGITLHNIGYTHMPVRVVDPSKFSKPETAGGDDNDSWQNAPDSFEHLPRRSKPAEPAGKTDGWWDKYSPLERKAYLTAHPNSSRASSVGDVAGAKIGSREDYHRASAAFHSGKVKSFEAREHEMGKTDSQHRATPRGAALASMRNSHGEALRLHRQALDHLAHHRQNPTDGSLRRYGNALGQIRDFYPQLDALHRKHGEPTGVGHTRYVSKE